MLRDIFLCMCVCWRKMISSLIGPCDQLLDLLSYPIFDLSMGYHPIRPEPTIFVMLSYSWLIPRAYTIISFGSDQCYHRVHLTMEFFLKGNLDELLLIPLTTSLSPPWFMLNIHLVLETSISIIFMFRSWSICWMEEVTSSNSCAFGASCRREFEKDCFVSFGIIPNQSCTRAKYSVVWRLATFILYVSLAH